MTGWHLLKSKKYLFTCRCLENGSKIETKTYRALSVYLKPHMVVSKWHFPNAMVCQNWEEVPFKLTTWNDNGCNTTNMIMAMLSIGRPYAIQKWVKRKRTSVRISPLYLKQNERRNECHVKWNENWGKKNGRRQEKVAPLWAMLYVTTDWIINNLLPSCAGDVDDVKCEIVNFLSPLDHNVRIIGSCWSNVTQSVDVIDIESRGRSSHSCECAPHRPFVSFLVGNHFIRQTIVCILFNRKYFMCTRTVCSMLLLMRRRKFSRFRFLFLFYRSFSGDIHFLPPNHISKLRILQEMNSELYSRWEHNELHFMCAAKSVDWSFVHETENDIENLSVDATCYVCVCARLLCSHRRWNIRIDEILNSENFRLFMTYIYYLLDFNSVTGEVQNTTNVSHLNERWWSILHFIWKKKKNNGRYLLPRLVAQFETLSLIGWAEKAVLVKFSCFHSRLAKHQHDVPVKSRYGSIKSSIKSLLYFIIRSWSSQPLD